MPTWPDGRVKFDAAFRAYERLLWGLSYRLTGSAADADDIVQETFVRALAHPPPDTDERWRPWLVRIAVNIGLDVLRRRKRSAYIGSWLPSPIETGPEGAAASPQAISNTHASVEGRYELLESVSFAFLLALEALPPQGRAVLLLRDVFDYSVRETATALGLSEANVRVLHHRARQKMRRYDGERCRPTASSQGHTQRVLDEFMRCLLAQDVRGIEALLVDAARVVTDAGGEYSALRTPLVGRSRVAQFFLRVAQRRLPSGRFRPCLINGLPALLFAFSPPHPKGAPRALLRCDINADGHIKEFQAILASRKLTAVRSNFATM